MQKQFHFIILDDQLMVLSLTHDRLDSYYEDIVKELIRIKYSGDIIFDLLISNGLNFNRFLKMSFEIETFKVGDAEIVKPTDKMLTVSKQFYSQNLNLVLNSILPRTVKQQIIKELTHDC